MTAGVPVSMEMFAEIREIVRAAAGPEICAAMDASNEHTRSIVEHMSDEEFANWIMCVGEVENV